MEPRYHNLLLIAALATAAVFISYKIYARKKEEEELTREELLQKENETQKSDVVGPTERSPAQLPAEDAKKPDEPVAAPVESISLAPKAEATAKQQQSVFLTPIPSAAVMSVILPAIQSDRPPAILSTESGTSLDVSSKKKDKKKKLKKMKKLKKKTDFERSLAEKTGSERAKVKTTETKTIEVTPIGEVEVKTKEKTVTEIKPADGGTNDVKITQNIFIHKETTGAVPVNVVHEEEKGLQTADKISIVEETNGVATAKNLLSQETVDGLTAKEVQVQEETNGVKTANLLSAGETKDVKTANALTDDEGGVRTADNLPSDGESKCVAAAKKIEWSQHK